MGEHRFRFSNWVEAAEVGRGLSSHFVWLKLHGWPVLCWNTEDVRAAVSGFGALWEVDEASESRRDVSSYRVQVRCRDVRAILESLSLFVEDRRFIIRIEVVSSAVAPPILLGEATDRRLGLDSADAQAAFLKSSGVAGVPAGDGSRGGAPAGVIGRSFSERPVAAPEGGSFLNPWAFLPLPPYSGDVQLLPSAACTAPDTSLSLRASGGVVPAVGSPPVLSPPLGAEAASSSVRAGPSLGGGPDISCGGPPLGNSSLAACVVCSPPSAQLDSLLGPRPFLVGSSSLGLGDTCLVDSSSQLAQSDSLLGPRTLLVGSSSLGLANTGLVDSSSQLVQSDPPSGVGSSQPSLSGPLVSSRPASASHLPPRKSIRLASKLKGNKLPCLKRAQVLRSKNLSFASASLRAGAAPLPPPASVASPVHAPAPAGATPIPPSVAPGGRAVVAGTDRDPAAPLSADEVALIKASCGILDAGMDSPPALPGTGALLACPALSRAAGL